MMFTKLQQWWNRSTKASKKRRQPIRRSRGQSRQTLTLEAFEERTMPSIMFNPQFGPESVKDLGGDRLQSPPVFLLFWGAYWQHGANPMAGAIINATNSLFPASGPSTFLSGLQQYRMDGQAHYANAVYVDSDPPKDFYWLALNEVVTQEINSTDYFPDPDTTPEPPIYVVFTPPGAISYQGKDTGGWNIPGLDFEKFPLFDTDVREQAWVGCQDDTLGFQATLDRYTKLLSHEVVEGMSDPFGPVDIPLNFFDVNGAISVDPGSMWTGKEEDHQLADYEGVNYTYRLNSNVVVQPYWSVHDNRWLVPDGNAQTFYLNGIWSYFNGDQYSGASTLDVHGDQFGANFDDTITIDTTARGGVKVTLNGETASFDPGQITTINVNTFGATKTNTVNVLSVPLDVSLSIEGSGNTVKVFNSLPGKPVSISGLGGNNTLILSGSFGRVTDTLVNPTSGAMNLGSTALVYTGIQTLTYDGGNGSNDRLVLWEGNFAKETYNGFGASTPDVAAGTIKLDGATINYAGLSGVDDLTTVKDLYFFSDSVFEHFSLSDGPFLQVGLAFSGQQTTQVTIAGDPSFLPMPDGIVTFANKTNVTVAGTSGVSGGIVVNTRFAATGLRNLTVNPGATSSASAPAFASILSTAPGLTTTLAKTGPGYTEFSVGSSFNNSIGPDVGVQRIRGPLVVADGGYGDGLLDGFSGTTLTVDDSGDSKARSVQINRKSITYSAKDAASVFITYTDTYRLNLRVTGGGGGNDFQVASLGDADHFATDLTLNSGSGSDRIEVLAAGFPFSMHVDGGLGVDTLTVFGFVELPQVIQGVVYSPPYPADRVDVYYQGIEHVVPALLGVKIPEGGVGNDPFPIALNIAGDLNGVINDTIVLRLDPNNANFLQALVNGVAQFDGPFAGFQGGISIDSGYGHDVIDIEDIPAFLSVETIERDTSEVNVGKAGSLQGILGILAVVNPVDLTALTLDDLADTMDHTVTVSNSAVRGLARGTEEDLGGAILYSQFDIASLTIMGGSGRNTFNVLSTPNPGPFPMATTTITSSGDDTVTVGDANGVQDIQGPLTVNSTVADFVTLNLNDQADAFGRTVTLASGSVSGLAPADINYGQFALANLAINGGPGANTFNVQSTPAPVFVPFVGIVYTNTTINCSGADTVNVGDANGVQDIQGPLTVNSTVADFVTLNLNDQADAFGRTVTLASGSVSGLAPADINYGQFALANLAINGGPGANTFNVQSTTAGTLAAINAGSGGDTVNVGSPGNLVDPIQGPLTINGQGGNNSLNLNDQSAADFHYYIVSATDVRRLGRDAQPDMAPITYTRIQTLTLNAGYDRNPTHAGSESDVIEATSTLGGTATILNGGAGNDEFLLFGSNSNMDSLQGPITLHTNGGFFDFVEFSDFLNPVGQTYDFTATSLQRSGIALVTWDPMPVGLFASVVGTGADHINVKSVSAGYAQSFLMGTGDILTIGSNAPALGGNLDKILGSVVAASFGDQTPTVLVDDSGDMNPHSNIVLDTDGINGDVVTGLAPAPIYFRVNTAATLYGGSGGNTFNVRSSDARTPITIDGGSGTNTLDYSASTSGVTVNLLSGTATGLAGISRIQNASGGAGNDILIGNELANVLTGNGGNDILLGLGGNDRLYGGAGRDILFGGLGADFLDGGAGDDILSGGYSDYDTQFSNGLAQHAINLAALNALMAEWASSDSYNVRFGAIKTGVGPTGQYRLDPTTVHDDAPSDTLTGGDGQDWFFVPKNGDTITDLDFNPSDLTSNKEKTTNIK